MNLTDGIAYHWFVHTLSFERWCCYLMPTAFSSFQASGQVGSFVIPNWSAEFGRMLYGRAWCCLPCQESLLRNIYDTERIPFCLDFPAGLLSSLAFVLLWSFLILCLQKEEKDNTHKWNVRREKGQCSLSIALSLHPLQLFTLSSDIFYWGLCTFTCASMVRVLHLKHAKDGIYGNQPSAG